MGIRSDHMIGQRWLVLIVLFVARSSMGYQFQSVASVAVWIESEFHVGYAVIGTLIGLYTIPGAILSLPGGLFGARYGDRAVCLTGLLLMIGGGLLSCAGDTVLPLTAGRLISGAGAILFNLVLTKMATDWFAGREIVFAMGSLMSSWPFGIALGLIVQGRIAEALGWRTSMALAALFCLVSLALVVTLYRPPPDGQAATKEGTWWNPPDWSSLRSLLVACVAWSFFNLGLIVLLGFGADLLAARGMAVLDASAVTSIPLWIAILSIPIGGLIVQRSKTPGLFAGLSYVTAAAALVALCLDAWPVIACIAFGLAIGPGPGAIMALPSRVLRPEHRITGLGIFGSLYGVIVGTGPWLAGRLAETAQTPAAAVLLGGALFAACVPLMILFEATVRQPTIQRS
jgi:predicted MFS family arabinose efflux permease